MEQKVRVYAVWLARFFFQFVTELIGIGSAIIKTNAYWLGSVFQPIAMRFDWFGLIGLVDLIWNINNLFLFFIFIKNICSTSKKICSTNLLTYDKLSNNYFHFIHYAKIFWNCLNKSSIPKILSCSI